MKTVVHHTQGRENLLHIETDGCIVNITCGLTDSEGRQVTSVEVLPDAYVGEEWDLAPEAVCNTRVIKRPQEGA